MNKNNPFEGKAVKFDTSEQLEHLAELARGYGLDVGNISGECKCGYFVLSANIAHDYYTNYYNSNGYTEIHYSDFIMNIEGAKEIENDYEKCVKNIYADAYLSVDTDRDSAKSFCVTFKGNSTPFFATEKEAWESAYYMLPPTPNPDPIARPEQPDMITHPPHYTVNGIEVIDVIENYQLNYRLGNVVKYVLRSDLKGNRLQDLKKALWYLQREIEQSEKQTPCTDTK